MPSLTRIRWIWQSTTTPPLRASARPTSSVRRPPACGELILDIVRELTPLTPEIALPLYVAISTDTGGFIYSNVTAATHRAAAELMDTGIDYRAVNKLFFQTKSRVRMQLEAAMLAEAKFYDNNRTAVLSVPPVAAGKIPRHGERCGGPLRFRPPDPGGGLRCDHAGAGRRRLEVLSPYWRAGQRYGGLPSVGWRRPCPRRGATLEGVTQAEAEGKMLNAIARIVPDFKK